MSRVTLCFALLVSLLAPATARAQATWTPYDRPAQYAVVTDTDVPVTMSDGTVLRADVHRPDAPGRFPVLLTQTPYNKLGPLGAGNDYLVQRGYVHVVVDVRGTGSSAGQWDSFGPSEQRDGKEMVDWAAEQPWSDGKVGTVGPSYMAITQITTAAQRPKALRAMFTIVPMGDGYRDITFSGGQTNTAFIPLWLGLVTGASLVPASYAAASGSPQDLVQSFTTLLQHAAGIGNFQASTVVNSIVGGDQAFDGPFWKTRSPLELVDRIEVPTFVVGGLHDLFQRGTPLIYERLKHNVDARLLMGPWGHLTGSQGDGLADHGLPSLEQIELRWFDHHLKGIDTRVGEIPRVTQYTWGAGRYEAQPDWPHPRLDPSTMYLRSGGTLAAEPPQAGEAPDTFVQNPFTGVCTQSTSQWTAGAAEPLPCTTDNRVNEAGEVTYTTPPLAKDLRLNGPITANLWLATTAADAVASVRVTDVAPDGTSTELTGGWLAASFRALDARKGRVVRGRLVQPWHPFTRDSVLAVSAGQPMELAVEVFPTNAVIPKGHSLRVSVGGGDFPHATPPLPQLADELGGVVEILHDAAHPSAITLPTIGERCVVPVPAEKKKSRAKKKKRKAKKKKKKRARKRTARRSASTPAPKRLVVDGCLPLPVPELVRG